jgi:hypothetical protein
MASKNPIQINTDFKQLLGGAAAGAGLNAASGMVGGGGGLTDKLMKGAIAGAAIMAIAPTGVNLVAMVWPDAKATAPKKP